MTTPSPTEARRDALVVNLLRLGYLDKHTARAIADAAFFEMQPLQPQAAQAVQADWKEAMLDGLASACLDAPVTETPRSILARIIRANVDMALSPEVSEETAYRAVQAVPLTEAQIQACLPGAVRLPQGWLAFARAIEAAHGIVAPAPSSDAFKQVEPPQPVQPAPVVAAMVTDEEVDAALAECLLLCECVTVEEMRRALTQFAASRVQPTPQDAKDAQRYRWLRNDAAKTVLGVHEWVGRGGKEQMAWLADIELDTAIDAALQELEQTRRDASMFMDAGMDLLKTVNQARELLERCLYEMHLAGWNQPVNDNFNRWYVFSAVLNYLHPTVKGDV